MSSGATSPSGVDEPDRAALRSTALMIRKSLVASVPRRLPTMCRMACELPQGVRLRLTGQVTSQLIVAASAAGYRVEERFPAVRSRAARAGSFTLRSPNTVRVTTARHDL